MYKKIIFVCLSLAILFSFAGCWVRNSSSDTVSSQSEKEQVIEEAQKYLEDKYPDDKFTYVSNTSNTWGVRYYEMNFSTQKYGEETFKVYADPKVDEDSEGHIVSRYRDENGYSIFDYYDTYYELLFKDDAQKFFSKKVTNNLGNDVVIKFKFVNALPTAKKVGNIYSLEEYIANHGDFCLVCCYTSLYEEMKPYVANLITDLKCEDIYGYIICISVLENSFDSCKDKSLQAIFGDWDQTFVERKDYYIYGNDGETEFDIINYYK